MAQRQNVRLQSVRLIVVQGVRDIRQLRTRVKEKVLRWRMTNLLGSESVDDAVEIFERAVLDEDFPFTFAVIDGDAHTQRALQ